MIPNIKYTIRAPYDSESFGFVEKAIIRYKTHFHTSNDGLDSIWYIASIKDGLYTVQPLKSRGAFSSPRIITKDMLLTNFTPIRIF